MQLRISPKTFPSGKALGLIAAALISFSPTAHAADGSQDYRFEVVDQPVAVSAHSEFNVRLTKASTGQPVENAQITRSRMEMTMPHYAHKGPIPMSTGMSGEVKPLGMSSPGLYRLMGDVSMPGTWKLDIVAGVPGEAKPVEGSATFKASQ